VRTRCSELAAPAGASRMIDVDDEVLTDLGKDVAPLAEMAEFRRGDLLDRSFVVGIVLNGLDGVSSRSFSWPRFLGTSCGPIRGSSRLSGCAGL